MPFLQELRDVTVPVSIKRGAVTFVLDAALEKFTPEEGQYKILRNDAAEVEFEIEGLRAQLNAQLALLIDLGSFDQIREDLVGKALEAELSQITEVPALNSKDKRAALRTAAEAARAKAIHKVTEADVDAEFNRRVDEQKERVEAIRLQLDGDPEKGILGAYARQQRTIAARIAYLVVDSDITDAKGIKLLSGSVDKTPAELEADTDFFFKNFSVKLLLHILDEVEGAIYGPLETATSSAK